ncbi:hypothetical protein A20C1_05597 [marine actinobacterium PHSC20C1]|nr:hypothetical protein A20C1_05597 [marine actinobacterium PHSC20C1]
MQDSKQTINTRAKRNSFGLAIWTFAWLVTLALTTFGPGFLGDSLQVAGWILIAANLIAGIGWIVAHARYLRGRDELQRKIILDAIAVALGAGLVGGFAYAAAHSIGLVTLDIGIASLCSLMAIVYLVATVVGSVRYR